MSSSTTLDTIFRLFDQSWFGLLLSTALALYSVYLTIRTSPRQQLSIVAAEGAVLEPAHPSWKDELKILYKDTEIPRLTAARVGIWNSGNSTIHGSQIVRDDPFSLSTLDGDTILRFHITGMSRPVIKASAEQVGKGTLSIDFDFLDPGDGFVLFIAHTSPRYSIRSSGTVRGLTAGVTPWAKHSAYHLTIAGNVLAVPALCVLLYLSFSAARKFYVIQQGSTASTIMSAVFIVLVITSMFFSAWIGKQVNSLIIRRIPKVIRDEESLRARIMAP